MNMVRKSYPISLNISVVLMTILLGTIVLSTLIEYSEITENLTHIVDFEEDGETEESEKSEVKDLSFTHANEALIHNKLGLSMILVSRELMETRHNKIPTPPPER